MELNSEKILNAIANDQTTKLKKMGLNKQNINHEVFFHF